MKKLVKFFSQKVNKKRDIQSKLQAKNLETRKELEIKVEEGTKRAIKEYGEVFKRLAEYDQA